MSATASNRRNGHSRQRSATKKAKSVSKAKPRRGAADTAKKAASKATKAVANIDAPPKPNKLARKLATRAIKKLTGRILESGAGLIRTAADKAAATGNEAAEKAAHNRLPIQRSVDVAVPVRVVWDEWLTFESLPEGVDTITDIERDGNVLLGRTTGPRPGDWEAEILDEREQESFAWQSHRGTDCAGLITFHELSDRLTRVELNLDVVPTSITETVQLTMHLADRRAEKELRLFKARLELINPDVYEIEEEQGEKERAGSAGNGSKPARSQGSQSSQKQRRKPSAQTKSRANGKASATKTTKSTRANNKRSKSNKAAKA